MPSDLYMQAEIRIDGDLSSSVKDFYRLTARHWVNTMVKQNKGVVVKPFKSSDLISNKGAEIEALLFTDTARINDTL